MNKPGTYLVSLSAYVKNYDVAVFQIAVKKGEHNNNVTLYSHHEDDVDGFDGAGTISNSTIYHLDHGDEISVEILSADEADQRHDQYLCSDYSRLSFVQVHARQQEVQQHEVHQQKV